MPSSLRLEHAAAILALVVVLVVLWLTQRRARQQRLRQLASTWGLEPRVDRQGRPYDGRERRDADVDHDRYRVDDHTWDDLDLAQLVESLDRTLTGIGAQTLYRAIRQPGRDAARATRRVAAARVALDDVDARVASQRLLLGFGEVAGWSIPAALWGALPRAPAPVWALRVLAWTLPISIGLAAWLGSVPLVLVASANAVINVGLHFRTTQRHHSEILGVQELSRMVALAHGLKDTSIARTAAPEIEATWTAVVRAWGRGAVRRAQRMIEPITAIHEVREYMRAFTLGKVITFFESCARVTRARTHLRALFDEVGEIDLCVALARLLHEQALAPAEVGGEAIHLVAARHPLIDGCVANDLHLESRGLALTGFNMAGKSTFLRTVGVNVILAQSLGLCACAKYQVLAMRVLSAMRVRDDLLAGRSSFRAEAERARTLLLAGRGAPKCLYLVDELFRGTNPVERTAAAIAVSRQLAQDGILLMATHDLDVVEALGELVTLAHFRESGASEEGLSFDYKLRPGLGTQRGAISVLRAVGLPASVIAEAEALVGGPTSNSTNAPDPTTTA